MTHSTTARRRLQVRAFQSGIIRLLLMIMIIEPTYLKPITWHEFKKPRYLTEIEPGCEFIKATQTPGCGNLDLKRQRRHPWYSDMIHMIPGTLTWSRRWSHENVSSRLIVTQQFRFDANGIAAYILIFVYICIPTKSFFAGQVSWLRQANYETRKQNRDAEISAPHAALLASALLARLQM